MSLTNIYILQKETSLFLLVCFFMQVLMKRVKRTDGPLKSTAVRALTFFFFFYGFVNLTKVTSAVLYDLSIRFGVFGKSAPCTQ